MTRRREPNEEHAAMLREVHRALLEANVGVDAVTFDRWGSWAILRMPGFAGPLTEWRAIALGDDVGAIGVRRGDTYEASPQTYRFRAAVIDVDVDTPNEREMGLEKSASGATLTEILGETRRQRATIDVAVALTILRALVELPAGSDSVLVDYDGALYVRRRAWSPVDPKSVPSWSWERRMSDPERARLLVDLINTLGLRAKERGDTHPGMTRVADDVVRALVAINRVTNERELERWRIDVRQRLAMLFALASTVNAHVLATMVRELFAERWRNEQRVLEVVLG